VYLVCIADVYLVGCSLILIVWQQGVERWRELSDGVMFHINNCVYDSPGASGFPGYDDMSAEGRCVMDDLASAYCEAMCFTTNDDTSIANNDTSILNETCITNKDISIVNDTASWLVEEELDTCMEEWGVEHTDAGAAGGTLDGAMWGLAASARAQHAGSCTTVPGANIYNGDLFDSPTAIAASDAVGATFLAQFRTVRAAVAETAQGLLITMQAHTEWIDRRDARTQGVFVEYQQRQGHQPRPSIARRGHADSDGTVIDVVSGVLLVCTVQHDSRVWSRRESALLRHEIVDRGISPVVHGLVLCPWVAAAPSVSQSASTGWSFRALHFRTSHGLHPQEEWSAVWRLPGGYPVQFSRFATPRRFV